MISGKTAIITGGASGIGAESAQAFAEAGANVVIADIADDAGRELARKMGKSVAFHHTDVADAASVEALIAFTLKAFGRLDVMFNNAGISEPMAHVALIDEDFRLFDKIMHVDVLGALLGTKFAARAMRDQRSGSIINTASTGGFHAGFGMPVYRAAKAAVIALTRNAAVELGPLGIRVNSISPGPTETPMAGAGLPPEIAPAAMRTAARLMTEMQILKRTGKPRDIANAALYLASEVSAQMTGQNLVVDGGQTVGDHVDRVSIMQAEFARLFAKSP
jgi:NAD(P)-dependent dehydrogenase (short-subunit alcohol dehydrogenase family)